MPPNLDPDGEKQKKDAEVRTIIERREREMADAKASKIEQERVEKERKAAEDKEFQKEVEAGRLRAEQKEEWRQGQHEKRREMERERLRKLEEQRQEQLKREAAEAKREKQKEYMQDLHRRSMFKKAAAMRKQALLDLEHSMLIARDHHGTGMREMERVHNRDKALIESEHRAALRRLDQQPLTADQKKRRAQEMDAQRLAKHQELDTTTKGRKAEVERLFRQEVARAEKIKDDILLSADRTQKL